MDHRRDLERWAVIGLFLLAFLPRAIYPVSRPLQWYFRSARFFQGILHGDWAGTLFSEHPGVTVMWLSGGALWGWYGLQSLLGLTPPTPLETGGYAFADRVAVGVVPLALVVALGIVWGWHLLHRLFGRRVAWVGALLWALDPFYLANSKVLHLDATLSTLMILSALWMLIYLRERHLRALIVSAILGGLAILTKVTALFLIPFWGLCLLTYILRNTQYAIGNVKYAVRDWLLWLSAATAICLALWPSFWVQPMDSLDLVLRQGILMHRDSTRDQPLFYRGTLKVQDPGPGFYLDVILYRTTAVTLPLLAIGLLALWRLRPEEHWTALLLIGFMVFYFVQMSLGGWKDSRYMLPLLLALDVLAACGLVWVADHVWDSALKRNIALAGVILAQACVTFAHHPHYGTHYNKFLGGSAAASRIFPLAEFGEGLDLAGQYVDSQPDAEEIEIGTQFLANEMVAQHVRAPVHDISQTGEDVGYLIFGVQYTTRGPGYPRWGKLWEQTYKFREPEFVVTFTGMPYAWVHSPKASPIIPQHVGVRLGDAVRLVGYRLSPDTITPGESLLLTLYWRGEKPIEDNYTVFTHLQNSRGELVAQQDNPPVRGTHPTSRWKTGALIEDPYEIQIPPDALFGDYTLSTGMYDPETMERLAAFDANGERLPNERVVLAKVDARPAVPKWRWALSGVWLAVLAIGAAYSLTGTQAMDNERKGTDH